MQRTILALALCAWAVSAPAANIQISTTDPANGITDLYSATFDGALNPDCSTAPDFDECDFFGGQTPAGRAIQLSPTPTGVDNGLPAGITPTPAAGSFLDIDLGAGNTQATLNGGVVYVSSVVLTIQGGTAGETNVALSDFGFELKNFAPVTASLDGDGIGIFEVDAAPQFAADFSTFSQIVDSCTGDLCALINILALDMVWVRLTVDFDSTFSGFDAEFVGATSGNSRLTVNLNSVPVPAAAWLFGSALGLLGWLRRRRS